MSKPIHRLGDFNDGGGDITEIPQNTVYANGRLVSIDGSRVEPHDLHFDTVTANGSTTVFIGGIPVNREGDEDECGHVRDGGSPDVFVGDINVGGGSAAGAVAGQGGGAGGAGNNGDANVTPPTPAVGPPNISEETLAAASVAMGRAVTSAVLDSGVAGRYSTLPFGANDSGNAPASSTVATAANFNFTEQDAKNLHANYLDRIFNTPAMKEKYPPWPRLPFGGDDAGNQ